MIIKDYKLLYILLAFVAVCAFVTYSYTLEDAQITYRYAMRYAEGYPWGTWNRNEAPIEGFTTFLWMLIISQFGPNLDPIIHASKIIGITSTLGLIVLYYQLAVKSEQDQLNFIDNSNTLKQAAIYTAIFSALSLPINWYSTTGMETTTYMFLVSASLFLPIINRNIYVFAALCTALILIRPEGIAFALSASIYYGFKDKRYFYILGLSVAVFAALMIGRYMYFGHFMPNTYYAKSGGASLLHIKYGILYFGTFAASYWYLFLPFLLMPSLILKKRITLKNELFYFLAIAGVVFYYCIIAKSGGDNFSAFPHWRHGLILMPIVAFCAFYTLFASSINKTQHIAKTICALNLLLPLFVVFPVSQNFAKYYTNSDFSLTNDVRNNPMLIWLKERSDKNITVATSLAGELPLTMDVNHIDILGLNDKVVANEGTFDPDGPIDSKTKMSYIIERQPELIEAYISPQCVMDGDYQCATEFRTKMTLELLAEKGFTSNYLIIKNAPYEHFNRAMFIRKDYYHSYAKAKGVEAISWSLKAAQ